MKSLFKISVLGGLALMLTGISCACKGRTAENMQPTGDTVEVEISHSHTSVTDTATPDSIPTEAHSDIDI